MFQIVVCEDSPHLLEKTSNSIEVILKRNNIPGSVVCKAESAKVVEDYLISDKADIFFLDISLNSKINGYELAAKIRENDNLAYIIFTTGHFEYALQAFKVKAFDFLTKPIVEDVLENCILRINRDYISLHSISHENNYIEMKSAGILNRINTNDIIYVEKLGFKIIIYTIDNELSYYDSLERFAGLLKGDKFIRCHKSFIANLSYASEINFKEKTIKFTTGHQCYIGDKFKKALPSSSSKSTENSL